MRLILIAFFVALSLAACGGQNPTRPSQGTATTPAVAAASPVTPESPAATLPSASATPKPKPNPTPAPTPAPTAAPLPVCLASQLGAKVTGWDGAMGHQIASVTLTNTSSHTCTVQGTPEVELVGAHGAILIDSQTGGPSGLPHIAAGAPTFHLTHLGSIKTMVQTANYCGSAPALPTTIAFVLPVGAGRLVARPGPGGTVPSCLGSPTSLGSISMNGWRK